MATVSKGKQGRVRKRASDGRLRDNKLKKKQARDKAAWNEFLGKGQWGRRLELVFTEYIELYPDSGGITEPYDDDIDYQNDDGKDLLISGSDGPVFTGRGTRRVDSFKRDRRLSGADGEKRVAGVDWKWAASDDALWNKQEARRSGRLRRVQYLPPNPIDWRLPLPEDWRNRYHELSAKYPLLITLKASDTFYLHKICHLARGACQNVFLPPYRPLFAHWAAVKSAFLAAQHRQLRGGLCPKTAVFLCEA
jgi:hypothetical protein